jgi:hypothetical protein
MRAAFKAAGVTPTCTANIGRIRPSPVAQPVVQSVPRSPARAGRQFTLGKPPPSLGAARWRRCTAMQPALPIAPFPENHISNSRSTSDVACRNA